jgi:hypothetical protein
MSHCRDFEEALWEAAEGRPLSAEVEAHLQACPSCRAAAQRLAEASRGFAALRAVEAPNPGAAVWGRVARPQRRPMFALAWAAGAVACVVATTFALRHQPMPPMSGPGIVAPTEQLAQAPPEAPAGPQVAAPAPGPQQATAEKTAPPANVTTGARETVAGGTEHRASTLPKRHVTQTQKGPQPAGPVQTQVAKAPLEGETTGATTAADDSCSEAAALAYRAIGRALVARFLSGGNETG